MYVCLQGLAESASLQHTLAAPLMHASSSNSASACALAAYARIIASHLYRSCIDAALQVLQDVLLWSCYNAASAQP